MDLLYRALGFAAAVNDTVQLSALSTLEETTAFILTSGTIIPGDGFQYGEQDDAGNLTKVTMEFLPIVDLEAKRGVFVQVNVPHRFTAPREHVELTGMLREMRPFLERELPTNFKHAGVDMLPGFVLVAGDAPGSPAAKQFGAGATGAFLLLFGLLTVKRNTVFRRHRVPPGGGSQTAGQSGIVRATGTFRLGKHTKRFIDTPAVLGTLENGDLALFANVDASSDFMGMTYAKRVGIWTLPIARGSLQEIEEGTMYFGRRALPAVRFNYRDGGSDITRTAIVSVPEGSLRTFTSGMFSGAARA